MVSRKTPQDVDTNIPRSYKGDQRMLVAIVYVALREVGYYTATILSRGGDVENPSGLCIGISGESKDISVRLVRDLKDFTLQDAEACARGINAQFQKVSPSAKDLATARQGTTKFAKLPYAEIVVRCPNSQVLKALYIGLGK